jgi:hypothetical protein
MSYVIGDCPRCKRPLVFASWPYGDPTCWDGKCGWSASDGGGPRKGSPRWLTITSRTSKPDRFDPVIRAEVLAEARQAIRSLAADANGNLHVSEVLEALE